MVSISELNLLIANAKGSGPLPYPETNDERLALTAAVKILDFIAHDFDPDKTMGPPCGPEALDLIKAFLSTKPARRIQKNIETKLINKTLDYSVSGAVLEYLGKDFQDSSEILHIYKGPHFLGFSTIHSDGDMVRVRISQSRLDAYNVKLFRFHGLANPEEILCERFNVPVRNLRATVTELTGIPLRKG